MPDGPAPEIEWLAKDEFERCDHNILVSIAIVQDVI